MLLQLVANYGLKICKALIKLNSNYIYRLPIDIFDNSHR